MSDPNESKAATVITLRTDNHGMGDVLTGMIAALIAQGLCVDDALLLAVHLHGAAGDELTKQSTVGMTATKLTDQARDLLNQWRSSCA